MKKECGVMENRTIYSLKKRLAAFGICIVMVCTILFAGAAEVRAEEKYEWDAFRVKVTTGNTVKAGKKVKFKVAIQNTTKRSLKLNGLFSWYYREIGNSEKYPGVVFGKLTDNQGKLVVKDYEVIRKVTFKAKEKKTFTLTGTMPKTWTNKSEITIVVSGKVKNTNYMGQGEYRMKKAAVTGTSLTRVTAGKKQATVQWKESKRDISGYQIQYATNRSFKGAKKADVYDGKKHTIKGLKSKKTYYIRIRTYSLGSSSNTAYSPWSAAKTVKIK